MKINQSLFVLGLVVYFIEGKLKCYVCDSRIDPKCGETFEYTEPQAINQGYVKTCENDQMCRKTIINIYKNNFVERECANSVIDGDCREYRQGESTVCDCTQDMCNGQSQITNYTSFIILMFAVQQLLF